MVTHAHVAATSPALYQHRRDPARMLCACGVCGVYAVACACVRGVCASIAWYHHPATRAGTTRAPGR